MGGWWTKRAAPSSYEAAERPRTVTSQRRRPLGVAISIIDGTGKYQRTKHAPTNSNLLVCRSFSEVACGLCRPIACLMAWAHSNAELSKIVPRCSKIPDEVVSQTELNWVCAISGIMIGQKKYWAILRAATVQALRFNTKYLFAVNILIVISTRAKYAKLRIYARHPTSGYLYIQPKFPVQRSYGRKCSLHIKVLG